MDKPTRAKAHTVYHTRKLVEASAAEPMDRPAAARFCLQQIALIQPADQQDEQMLALISNLIHMSHGE